MKKKTKSSVLVDIVASGLSSGSFRKAGLMLILAATTTGVSSFAVAEETAGESVKL